MRQVSMNVYNLHELTASVRALVIERYREIDIIDLDIDRLKYWLDDLGFENAEISYSVGGCQGDGASFTADVDLEKIFNTLAYRSYSWDEISATHYFLQLKERNIVDYHVWVERGSHHYSHEKTCNTLYEVNLYQHGMPPVAVTWFEVQAAAIKKMIEELRSECCQCIHTALQAEYDHQQSDECIIEALEDDEFTFDGDRYNEL